MAQKIFVDTNIFVYAHDAQAGNKHALASKAVAQLWEDQTGVLSLQVLQEFYVTVTRKIATPLSLKAARKIIELYGDWEVVCFQTDDLLAALVLQEKYHFSFWDALIVHAAVMADCSVLFSEDFQHGQKVGPLVITNPFF